MIRRVAKVFQKQVYSLLSSKCALATTLAALFIVAVSLLQFGEVLVEWSIDKYEAQFSTYRDNIGGRSFEKHFTVELPIDVVYTWVNGTDPILLRELNQLKREMRQKLEKEKLANQKKNGTADDQQKADIFNCPFANCVPWRTLVVSSDGHENYTHEDLAAWSNCMSTSLSFDRAESPHSKESAFFLRFKEENDVSICLELGLVDEEGAPVQCTRGYLTSDGSLADAISIPNFSVVTWNGSDPRRSITKRDFQKALSTALPRVSVLVDVAKNRTAVVEFKSEQDFSKVLEGKSSVNFQVKVGEESVELTVHSAHLVWTPFRFHNQWRDDTSQDGDIISANRFEDNEELKYSLRSLEKYAPWVRQVFIVTNGQIPHWLNLDNPRVTLVTHEEIFTNLSHLPTYSSPAIESHIHRIKGLSKQFIYFNDDVLLGEEVWPEDFYTTRKGQKVYLAWAVPYCSDGCPPNWINDKYCDSACNNSACEWDGDDCKNATRRTTSYTGQSSYTSTTSDNCNTGCLNNWLGDRYCDAACHVHNCGYDAGDCDVDKFHHLYSVDLQPDRANYSIPLGVKAMFFNLTGVFGNGTSVTKATFTTPSAVRTAVVSQKHKVLSFTFVRNVSLSSSQVLLEGKDSTGNSTIQVKFTIFVDTATPATESRFSDQTSVPPVLQSFADFNDTSSQEFLQHVAMTIQNANKSINYWVTERPTSTYSPTTLTPTEEIPAINFTAVPTDILPLSAQGKLETLTKEFNEGDWTLKGYSKNRYLILGPYLEQLREWARNVEENPVIKSANVTAPHVNTSTDSLGKDVVAVTGEPQDSPPTRDLKSPPTRDLESPPTQDIESPPTQDLKSPPTRDLKSPPTRDLKSPPTRESPPDGHSPPGGDGPPGLSEVQEGKIEGTSNNSKKEPSNQALPANNSTTGTTTSPTTGTSSPTTGMTSSPTTGITSSLTTDTTTSSLTTDTTTSPTTVSDKSTSQGAPGSRKLLSISPNTDAHLIPSSQELKLAEEIRRGKEKQLRQQKDIKDAIRKWESLYGHWDSKRLLSNSLPWEREEYFPSDQVDKLYREEDEETMATSGPPVARRHLLDTFANSLRHSNQLYNRVYGYVARKVPAHMPHFINRDIMEELKEKFSLEFANTSSHKLRSPYDLQFSFSYFYYLMSEPAVVDHAKLFAAYDTDGSGILSARELRTLLTRVEESKHITAESIDNFQWLLGNCSLNYTGVTPQVTEEEFRTLYDPNFALVTEDFMMQCKPLLDKLSSRRAKEKKYKFEELSDNDIGFKMVNENVSLLVDHLDDLRREPKKFICINDNINHTSESAHLAKLYIKDYYEAVFPKQSQFELPPVYRNRFLKVEDLREWQSSQLLKERLLLALLISVMLSALIAALWDQIVYVKRFLVRRLFARQSRHKTR